MAFFTVPEIRQSGVETQRWPWRQRRLERAVVEVAEARVRLGTALFTSPNSMRDVGTARSGKTSDHEDRQTVCFLDRSTLNADTVSTSGIIRKQAVTGTTTPRVDDPRRSNDRWHLRKGHAARNLRTGSYMWSIDTPGQLISARSSQRDLESASISRGAAGECWGGPPPLCG